MTRRILSFGLVLAFLVGCTEAYEERTTPANCACGNWVLPAESGRVIV